MFLMYDAKYLAKKIHYHIKLEVVRTGVLLLFSVKSIIQKEAFINFRLIFFFLKMAKQAKGK